MSTPTPTHPPQPSSASKKAAGHVTTPSHLGLSPAPRSIPSPATARKEQAAKTPINHPTVSSTGSKTLGGTPMMATLSQTGMTVGSSSPGTQMVPGGGGSSMGISFGTPLAGLGVDLSGGGGIPSAGSSGTPGGLVAAALMATSVSELGRELGITVGGTGAGGTGGIKRNEDEERRAKMRRVLKSIGKPKGRVSEEGIARISRRVGFQNDIDAEKLTAEEKERKVGNRLISIAGKTILVDVELKNHVAQNVQVMFNANVKALEEQGVQAGKVLLKDLAVVDGVSLDAKLDRFASNLDCLARVDRLCERIDCFEAISGLYTSLRRLYELEKEALKMLMGSDRVNRNYRAEMETMCKKSGRPTMHENGRIGFSLDYWSMAQYGSDDKDGSTAMEIDNQDTQKIDHKPSDIFSIRVEVEPSPAAMFPSLRVSDEWLPNTFELPSTGSNDDVPWQEPPPTYMSGDVPGDQGDSMVIDESQKLPDLRFIAKLDPPIIMPLQIAMNISNVPQLAMPQGFPTEQYHGMLLNMDPQTARLGNASFTAEQTVLSSIDDKAIETLHHYMLDISKPDWGSRLEELPFSHPRQLIELLPILRQWAHFGAIVQRAFEGAKIADDDVHETFQTPTTGKVNGHNNASSPPNVADLNLDDIMSTNEPNGHAVSGSSLHVDLTLSTSPQPAISLTFPGPPDSITVEDNITLQFLPNGDVSIPTVDGGSSMDIVLDDASDGTAKKSGVGFDEAQKLAKALGVCGDLGVWIEWVRGRRG